jgi:hypothetical protein
MSATIRTATPTVTHYQKLAQQFSEQLDDVAALIPDLESPHPLTANFVRSHVNVPFEFLRTAIFAVEQVPELRGVNKLDVDAARATLQFTDAFQPVYDKLMRLARSLKFTMSSRKAHLAAEALQIYWIGRGLARDRRGASVVPIVAALKRDLGRRGPGKARRRAASAGEVLDVEAREQLAPPDARDAQHAAVEVLLDPLSLQRHLQQGGAEGAGEVRAALAPVETGEREAAAESSGGLDVDAERFERLAPRGRELVGVIALRSCEPSQRAHAVVQQHAERAGDVVVARAGGAQNLRRMRDQALARAGQHAERFQRRRHVVAVQTEVPMLPLCKDLDELLRGQPLQVHAGRRRRDAGEHGQLRARAAAAVREGVEHPGARRLADGGGDPGDGFVVPNIHTLMVNEAFPPGNAHSDGHDDYLCDPLRDRSLSEK